MPSLAYKSSRPSPSHSPYKSPSPNLEPTEPANNPSALLSRLRAGSLPQRSPFAQHIPGTSSPFGPGIFSSSSWNPVGRERGSTLASIASVSTNGPSSPTQSQLSRDGVGDNDVPARTLDYLGLIGTPQPQPSQLDPPYLQTMMPDFARQQQASRFRSYSVNNTDTYEDDEEDDDEGYEEDTLESQYQVIQQRLAATQAAIRDHNLAVQAFANQAARPRARTAGVLDTPNPSRLLRSYYPTPSRLDNSITAAELGLRDDKTPTVDDLGSSVAAINLGRSNSRGHGLLTADEPELGPTSALWLGSIPTSTTTTTLTEMFKQFGPILFTRVLTHKNCGFVNFERIDSAMSAKNALNGKEIFPGAGPVRINFAKPPSASNTPGPDGAQPSPSPVPFSQGQNGAQIPATAGAGDAAGASASVTPTVPPLSEMTADILNIVREFGATDEDVARIHGNLQAAVTYDRLVDEIPPVGEPTHTRMYDAPKLRDIRKRIDNATLSQAEIENIAHDMLPEIAELASDYLGNTVVQKLFEQCSDPTRDAMLEMIAPHLAEIGVHKNGTWAAQKIITVCKTESQMEVIKNHLRPYTVPLFLDQYGNYVLQGCLKFGAPYTDFIFETMISRMWHIAQGRFGSRGMRACLESHHASKDQQRLLAAAIALHSVQLATNHNAALLLTWFLDTCTFPHRRTVLAPQLVPYLVTLCTQKVAYLTVLKVINQKTEPEARDKIVEAMFFSQKDQILESILSDSQCGATLIFKVITTPFFDEAVRNNVVENVKAVLLRIKAQPDKGYKRLMDEVGLSTRNGNGGSSRGDGGHQERHRGTPRANNNSQQQQQQQQREQQQQQQAQQQAQQHQQHQQQQQQAQQQAQQAQQAAAAAQFNVANNGGQYYNPLNAAAAVNNPPGFDGNFGVSRNDIIDPSLQQYSPYATQTITPAMNMQQMQYQQNMMRGTPPISSYYPMQTGVQYPSASPSIDQYRASPVPQAGMPAPNQSPYAASGFPMSIPMNMGGFPYGMSNAGYNMPDGGMNGGTPGRRGGRGGRQGRHNTASPRPY
ncbi:hypothetical protein VPNG_00962 [Cytospora leucostoma]|uniref:PUM-HD domain-containing protein n=1 Tax=Cytospora leucostoma TaxID=1230097 RepID=A0A423XLP4_9PEZI|nr:hypothetical protein VPNG_00962 [Cytospora leucostoma]